MASSDVNNFSSSSPHRLPTLSASQALQNLSSTPRKPISTGLQSLDAVLQGRDYDSLSQNDQFGGISRGELTEVYGPPGVGKTAFAIQVSANVLRSGGSVVWVDASYKLVGSRLKDALAGLYHPWDQASSHAEHTRNLDNFHHFAAATLPHLLALLTRPSNSFPPLGTSLIVVDSVSTLFALAFPKTTDNADKQQTPIKKSDAAQWAVGRRWAVMGEFVAKLGKLAATRNIAVLLTSQTTTRIRSETGAILHPAISSTAWDTGIGTRLVLFRDWMFQTADASSSQGDCVAGVRFAGVVKAKSILYEGVGKVVTFKFGKDGLCEVKVDQADIRRNSSPVLSATSLKRKREEIADSQSEEEEPASDQEFGWAGGDDTLEAEGLLD